MGVRSIADDADLHGMWIDSMKEAAQRSTRYQDFLRAGSTPTGRLARGAFDDVRDRFLRRVADSGRRFPGYSFDRIHHWNWPIGRYAGDALNPAKDGS